MKLPLPRSWSTSDPEPGGMVLGRNVAILERAYALALKRIKAAERFTTAEFLDLPAEEVDRLTYEWEDARAAHREVDGDA